MRKIAVLLVCFAVSLAVNAKTAKQSWYEWKSELRQEALSEGISAEVFDSAFNGMGQPNRKVRHYSKSQPEHRLTFEKYRRTRASKNRIAIGKREYRKNKELLDSVGQEFGVDPCFIVSFWGMETSYGNFMGSFPVVKSLATLAYDSKRKKFFRKELLYALRILNDGHVSLRDFKGEWAGATGQPQFLPSSWIRYAIDYDRDGRKDIWRTKGDVFASIANYVKNKGWKTGEPWAIKVKLPRGFDMEMEGKKYRKPVETWEKLGVRTLDGSPLPYKHLEASVIKPYGSRYAFLAFTNFRVIMRYNNSTYYAGSIGYMADKICGRKN